MATRKFRSVNESDSVFASLNETKEYPKTGLINQGIKLFIEGVEVPWLVISVNQSYNSLPTATIQIPYFAGLNEICKNYAPKVHIFYHDYVYEKYLLQKGKTDYTNKDLYRTLFEGVLFSSSYGRAKGPNSGSASISFMCLHKYSYLGQIALKFGGRGAEEIYQNLPENIAVSNYLNSSEALLVAMASVENTSDKAVTSAWDPVKAAQQGNTALDQNVNVRALPPDTVQYFDRLQGTPGIAAVLWNSMKRDSYFFRDVAKIMTDLYIPLVDGGLRFFKRMTGHPSIEKSLDNEKAKITNSDLAKKMSGQTHGNEDTRVLVPPVYRNFLNEAVATELGVVLMEIGTQISGDRTSFWDMIMSAFQYMEYDMQVLASPVQVKDSSKDNIDVVVKPVLPYYYAPTCNVLLPHMYTSIQINDSTNAAPSRLIASQSPIKEGIPLEYRAPHEVRQVAAINSRTKDFNLRGTFAFYGEYPTPTEMGRGIVTKKVEMQPWVIHLFNAYKVQSTQENTDPATAMAVARTGGITIANNPAEPDAYIWQYWDKKNHPIPIYRGSRTAKGKNIAYGTAGALQIGNPVYTQIETFRNSTAVPKFWNVVFFPFNNSYFAYPPHYDYVNQAFYITDDIPATEAAKYNKGADDSYDTKELNRAVDAAKLTSPEVPPVDPLKSGFFQDPELEKLRVTWFNQHPNQEALNPFAPTDINGAQPYQDTLINTLDYKFALALTETRQGVVDGMFNPYIVPGYPMDIIDPSPERPSFHAFCLSVTHSFTPRSSGTSISFSNVLSYDELRNYELPALLPWFQKQLGFHDKLSLVHQTSQATQLANKYYMEVLGCGYADPTFLENEETNSANFVGVNSQGDFYVTRTGVSMAQENSRQGMLLGFIDQNMSYEGNLALIRREIENMSDIEANSGITFVEIPYDDPTSVKQSNSIAIGPLYAETLQKPGRSLFLDYTNLDTALQKETGDKLSNPRLKKGV